MNNEASVEMYNTGYPSSLSQSCLLTLFKAPYRKGKKKKKKQIPQAMGEKKKDNEKEIMGQETWKTGGAARGRHCMFAQGVKGL